MTLTVIVALYGLALLGQLGTRAASREGEPGPRSKQKLSLLRALIPRYHFFDVIEERFLLGVRPRNADVPFTVVNRRKQRRLWFLFENAEENLGLFEESALPLLAEMLDAGTSEERVRVENEFARRLRTEVDFDPDRYEYALLGGGSETPRLLAFAAKGGGSP